MSDTKATVGTDPRLKKEDAASARGDRASADLQREMTDGTVDDKIAQFKKNFQNEWTASALPTPPALPGYHLIWLSTTSSYDPIYKRLRLGYEPVASAELPGFEQYKMNSGEYEGMIGCNEMVLFKLPMELYSHYMQEFHHNKPLEEEAMIKANPILKDQNAVSVVEAPEDDGFGTIVRSERPPKFVN